MRRLGPWIVAAAFVLCQTTVSAYAQIAQAQHAEAQHAQAQNARTKPPDKALGLELAQRLCVNCHSVVAGTAPSGEQAAPSFARIAGKPGQTSERIAGAIIIPHPDMPAVSLTMQEIRDIVAYIASLNPPP